MFSFAASLMFSIGKIWREEKKEVPKRNKQTNKKQDKQTINSIWVSYFLLILHSDRVQKEIGDVCT